MHDSWRKHAPCTRDSVLLTLIATLLAACSATPPAPDSAREVGEVEVAAAAEPATAGEPTAERSTEGSSEDATSGPTSSGGAATVALDAEPEEAEKSPWERFHLGGGYNFVFIDSQLRVGLSGVGIAVDLEKLLDLDTTTTIFRIGGGWRFTENRKHRVDAGWLSIDRTARTRIGRDLDLGNGIVIPLGTTVRTELDVDIYELSYGYSLLQDDRFDLGFLIGVYTIPISLEFDAQGLFEASETANFIAPLPELGLRGDFAITPRLFLRSHVKVFYLEIDDYRGLFTSFLGSLEYRPWYWVAIGVGAEAFNVNLKGDGDDFPGGTFVGELNIEYTALMSYLRFSL